MQTSGRAAPKNVLGNSDAYSAQSTVGPVSYDPGSKSNVSTPQSLSMKEDRNPAAACTSHAKQDARRKTQDARRKTQDRGP